MHGRLGGIRKTPGYLQKQHCHLPEETGVQLLCTASYDIWCRAREAQYKLAAAQTKMEISMLNITYKDKGTNFCARERTKVLYVISNSRKRSGTGHGTATASTTTGGPRLSPLEDHSTKKTRETSQAVERRPG